MHHKNLDKHAVAWSFGNINIYKISVHWKIKGFIAPVRYVKKRTTKIFG